ncbi:phage tail tape measure protein [bacterium]|nr:phage tail tape measure protein [bacterium]
MANIVSGVTIKAFDKFSAVMDKFNNKIDVVTNQTKKSRMALDQYRQATQSTTDALKRMALVGGAALTGVAVLSTKAGMKFEDASAGFTALTGATGDSLKFMQDKALIASKKYGISASAILEANTKIASANSILMRSDKALELSQVTASASILAKISGLSADESGKNLVNAMNLFGFGLDESNKVVDQLAQSSRIGILEVGPLSAGFKKAAVQAASAGIEMKEYLSILQVGGLSGQTGAMVGTQLKNIIPRLTQVFPQFASGAITATDALEKLSQLNLSTVELTELGFNIRDIATLGTLIKKDGLVDNIAKLKEFTKATSVSEASGQGLRMYAARASTLGHQFNILGAIITEKFIRLYENFLRPILIEMAGRFGDFIEWMFKGSKGANAFNLALGAVGVAITTLTLGLSGLFASGGLLLGIKAATLAFAALGTVINLSFVGLPMILGAIVTAIPAIWALSAWMRKGGKDSFFAIIIEDLKEFFKLGKDIINFWLDPFLEAISLLLPKGSEGFKTWGVLIKDALKFVFEMGAHLSGAVLASILAVVTGALALVRALSEAWDWLKRLDKFGFSIVAIKLFDEENIIKALTIWEQIKDFGSVDHLKASFTGNLDAYESSLKQKAIDNYGFANSVGDINSKPTTVNISQNITGSNVEVQTVSKDVRVTEKSNKPMNTGESSMWADPSESLWNSFLGRSY